MTCTLLTCCDAPESSSPHLLVAIQERAGQLVCQVADGALVIQLRVLLAVLPQVLPCPLHNDGGMAALKHCKAVGHDVGVLQPVQDGQLLLDLEADTTRQHA
jgi:hypothetical protein